MSPRNLAQQLRDSPATQKYVALALIVLAAILVVVVTLSNPNLR